MYKCEGGGERYKIKLLKKKYFNKLQKVLIYKRLPPSFFF